MADKYAWVPTAVGVSFLALLVVLAYLAGRANNAEVKKDKRDTPTPRHTLELVVYSTPGCVPCKKQHQVVAGLKSWYRLDNWTVTYREGGRKAYPALEIYLDGEKVWEHEGYLNTPALLDAVSEWDP